MQFDIISDPVALFLTVGLSILFGYFFREIGGKIKERFKPAIQVTVKSAVHKFDAGLFLHSIDLKLSNTTETEMRIDNITLFDKHKRELRYVTRGDTSAVTEFNIGGSETQDWSCFCHREPTGETDWVKLRLAIERTGKRTLRTKFESRLVREGEFPTGVFIYGL